MKLLEFSRSYIGKPYELGETDCFAIVFKYLKLLNPSLPDQFDGTSWTTYPLLFKLDKEEAYKKMLCFIESFFPEKSIGKSLPGDILFVQFKNVDPFLSIDVGNGYLLASCPELGVNTVSKSFYKILRCFSCHRQFRSSLP
jgi:hypothetical protein